MIFPWFGAPMSAAAIASKLNEAEPDAPVLDVDATASRRCTPSDGVSSIDSPSPIISPFRCHVIWNDSISESDVSETVIGMPAVTVSLSPVIVSFTGTPVVFTSSIGVGSDGYLSMSNSMVPTEVCPSATLTTSVKPASASGLPCSYSLADSLYEPDG